MSNLRGKKLDKELQLLLSKKIKVHPDLEPINANRLSKELKLNSRSTLLTPIRKTWIINARNEQFERHGMNLEGKPKKRDKDLQIERLKEKLKQTEIERDNLIEKIAQIINGAQAHGIDVDKIMMPIM